MAKIKTSAKQKISSKNTWKPKLRLDTGIVPYSPTEEILQGDLIGKAILDCLRNNDPQGVMEIVAVYLKTVNRVKIAQKAHLSRSTLYNSLRYKNPTIKTLAKIMATENNSQPHAAPKKVQ